MDLYECNICKNTFKTLFILNKHKKSAKYCKKISNNIQHYLCVYCNKEIENVDIHISNCIEYYKIQINNKDIEIESYKKQINNLNYSLNTEKENYKNLNKETDFYKKEIELYKSQNSKLEDKINDITLKLIDKPVITNYNDNSKNNNTNNTKIDIFNSLTPLTDNDFKEHIDKLTIEHIKRGAEGYAEYTLKYPLKNKLMCLDHARKKICYKDEQGHKIEEYKLDSILPKVFKELEIKNKEIIHSMMNDIFTEFCDYESTITEFEDGSVLDKEYSKRIEDNQNIIYKYSNLTGDCHKIATGNVNNKLGNEIADIVINKIPRK